MTDSRQYVADVLFTAAILGVGLLSGNPILASVVAGIGVNLASDLTRAGWGQVCQRLLGESGFLNHDLQQALARAFRQALTHLEQTWRETPDAKHIRRVEPGVARETAEVFKMLREDAAAFCSADSLGRAAGNEQVRQLLYGDETSARRAVAGCLSDYLHGHDPGLIAFLDAHLVQALAFRFGEELKADRPESNRAWRAFQRLLLEGLQTSLAEVRAEQQETQQILEGLRDGLQAWAERMEALSDDVRERTGEERLLQATASARADLLAAIVAEADLTRAAIDAGVEQVTRLFSVELARLRSDLLPRLGERGLSEALAPLQVDLRRHFDGLLRDYALFGGRADEIAVVSAFLADPQGGYLFLTGPSGYGKTALLVQIARQGEAAYHFLNRTYGTANEDLLLRNICQQLAVRHGLGGRLPAPAAELRALYPDLLRLPPGDGRSVVVLIDGLDEAANWEPGPLLFPPDLPDGVKVIFSARQVAERDWPNHLRLPAERVQRLTLGALTADDVRSLLRAAGGTATPLADDPGWIAQALRVSAGDPFYVKLLVEDIRDGRMRPEQIGGRPAGLDAYLKGWWEQVAVAVRAQDVRDLLGSLAVARGLLGRNDLVAMFPELSWALDGVLTEVRRFVIGGEQQGYALCHPRFADYVRWRVGPRALQTYTEALLAYCVNWREHRSPYAFRYATAHLLEAERWQELLDLVDKPFLRAKVQRLRSYGRALEDLRNGVHAARAVHDPAKMLGLALAHAGLQAKVVQLAAYDVLPLYARFGEPERALELADTIADETQRAKTLVAVARELLPSEPDRARQIVRRTLANWRRYPVGYDCGAVLRGAFTVLPAEVIGFLESVEDFSPVSSLGNCTYLTYQAVDQLVPTLEPALQNRLRAALRRALALPTYDRDRSDLRFLLARLEPDPDEAAQFADSEPAHVIVQAKRDALQDSDGRLDDRTVDRAIQLLVDTPNRLAYDEKWTLLYAVVAPHAAQFASVISTMPPSGGKVHLLLQTALVVAELYQEAERARALLLEALQSNEEIPSWRVFDGRPIGKNSYPSELEELVGHISEGLAQKHLDAAFSFLQTPGIDFRWGLTVPPHVKAVVAAAKTNPQVALQAADKLGRSRNWARAMIAEHVAGTDLESALSIWRELDPSDVDRPRALIRILENASPSAHIRASEVLDVEFEPEPKYRLYKIPVQLDIAAKLNGHQPEQAGTIVHGALEGLLNSFDREGWSKPQKELLLVRVIPAMTVCGLVERAKWFVDYYIKDEFGLSAVAAADMFCLLADEDSAPILTENFGLKMRGLKMSWQMALREALEKHPIDDLVLSLHWTVSEQNSWRAFSISQFDDAIADLIELSSTFSNARLIGLHLLHKGKHGGPTWDSDHVKALLAAKTVPFYTTSAWRFIPLIEDQEVRELALAELYGSLPLEVVSQGGGISQDRLRAIASLRASAREADAVHKQGFLDEAFALARNSIENADEFTLDLLIEFVREAYPLDAQRASQFAGELIASILAAARDSAAHRMFELGACGYTLSADERLALEELSDHWVNRLEHMQEGSIKRPPIGDQDAHRLAAIWLARAARSTLLVNRERGLRIVSMASRHADGVTEPTERTRLRREILKSMLATGDAKLWEEAVVRSLDFEDAMFHVFDRFGQSALKLYQEDKTLPSRLLETITWAEQLMRV